MFPPTNVVGGDTQPICTAHAVHLKLPNGRRQPPLMTARVPTGNAPMDHHVENAPEAAVGSTDVLYASEWMVANPHLACYQARLSRAARQARQ
jgi:hypothetical protein